jgi:hypothetical protein
MASNLNIDKFKGDNTQNVDTWLSMYKHYCSFYDVSNKKSECGVLSGVPGGFADVWCSA